MKLSWKQKCAHTPRHHQEPGHPNSINQLLEDTQSTIIENMAVILKYFVVFYPHRLAWERLVARPIGRRFHISERAPPRARHNVTLEAAYRKFGKHPPGEYVLEGIGKQADWSVQHVQRYVSSYEGYPPWDVVLLQVGARKGSPVRIRTKCDLLATYTVGFVTCIKFNIRTYIEIKQCI